MLTLVTPFSLKRASFSSVVWLGAVSTMISGFSVMGAVLFTMENIRCSWAGERRRGVPPPTVRLEKTGIFS